MKITTISNIQVNSRDFCIGNFIIYKGEMYCLTGEDVGQIDASWNCFDVIKLTPELLQQCGFVEIIDEEMKRGIGVFVKGRYDLELVVSDGDEYSFAIDENEINTKLKYLHQLQNLYFSLTGTELEVKIPTNETHH